MSIEEKIEIINQLIIQDSRGIDNSYVFTNDTDLINDLGFDSVAFIQLVVNLEMEFDFEFGDMDILIDNLANYRNLKEYVLKNASI